MIWLGILIVVLTFVAIAKKYEPRMTLFISALLMCALAGDPLKAFNEFSKALISDPLVPIIVSAMGFAHVMSFTECDKHFSYFALQYVIKCRALLIPGTVVVIWVFNIAITSAAGLCAAVGPIIIPVLIRAGIHPALAAATFLTGSWGLVMSVGAPHNAVISKLSGTDVASLVIQNAAAAAAGLVVCCVAITLIALIRKENKGYIREAAANGEIENISQFKISYIKVIMPLLPVVMILLGSKQIGILPPFTVPQAMILCTILAFFVTRLNPAEITKRFYLGLGESFGFIISLIAAATAFAGGMQALGLTNELVNVMKSSTAVAKLAGAFGPLVIAVLSGSGDAAVMAFNASITPHAPAFGLKIDQLGMLAHFSGILGRAISPVAGATIICAQIAAVNPFEISKRVAPVLILMNLVVMFILVF